MLSSDVSYARDMYTEDSVILYVCRNIPEMKNKAQFLWYSFSSRSVKYDVSRTHHKSTGDAVLKYVCRNYTRKKLNAL